MFLTEFRVRLRRSPVLEDHAALYPWHAAMVRISGGFEFLGGFGLFVPATRRASAWGLVVLLVAVFPATSIWRCIRPRPVRLASRRC